MHDRKAAPGKALQGRLQSDNNLNEGENALPESSEIGADDLSHRVNALQEEMQQISLLLSSDKSEHDEGV